MEPISLRRVFTVAYQLDDSPKGFSIVIQALLARHSLSTWVNLCQNFIILIKPLSEIGDRPSSLKTAREEQFRLSPRVCLQNLS